MPEVIGYARVSTASQDLQLQLDALREAGCTTIVEERASGADRNRPELKRILARLKRGDTLVVWKLDRVGRSLQHLLDIIDQIGRAGAHFRCLGSPVDTSSPAGKLMMQMLGAFAEFERDIIIERTNAGLAAARSRGRVGGNPRLKSSTHKKAAAEIISLRRRETFLRQVQLRLDEWKAIAERMRPGHSWAEVLKAVNQTLPEQRKFTQAMLLRHARAAVGERLADGKILQRARPADRSRKIRNHPAYAAICMALRQSPRPRLREIADSLKAAGVRTARGSRDWPLSSLSEVVARVEATLELERTS